jgi:hypothetical protein
MELRATSKLQDSKGKATAAHGGQQQQQRTVSGLGGS